MKSRNSEKLVPPQLNSAETEILSTSFIMANWEFEQLFLNNCIRIGHRILAWEKQEGTKTEKCIDVCIYGIQAKYPSVKYPIITKFYIHYDSKYRVYQRQSLEDATRLVDLIQKQYFREKVEEKIRKEKATLKVA